MASRLEQKQRMKAEREATEAAEAARARRTGLAATLAALVVGAAVVVGIFIVISSSGGSDTKGPVEGRQDTVALLDGIPQQGAFLGDPDAPVTMVEYADLRCPICKEFAVNTLPTLVQDYVRDGQMRIELRLQTFVGEQFAPGDSERGARFALAAGEQDHLWNFAELFYRNQGEETEAYADDALLRRLGGAVPGLDIDKALVARDSQRVSQELTKDQAAFETAGFTGTPSFQIGKTGGKLSRLNTRTLAPEEFKAPIDALLK